MPSIVTISPGQLWLVKEPRKHSYGFVSGKVVSVTVDAATRETKDVVMHFNNGKRQVVGAEWLRKTMELAV